MSETNIPPIPEALYSCHICREDYSWPASDIWLCANGEWTCQNCFDDEGHECGDPKICLADVIKQNAERATADLRAKLADAERERDEARKMWEHWQTDATVKGGELSRTSTAEQVWRNAFDEAIRQRDAAIARAEAAEHALQKINVIRNSIVAHQSCNFSEHVYPLVAALNEAGIEGMPYPDALAYFGPTTERAAKAEAERDELRREVEALQKDCARISEECGLPPSMAPAAGEIARIIARAEAAEKYSEQCSVEIRASTLAMQKANELIDQLKADKARLDWLEENERYILIADGTEDGLAIVCDPSLRQAIDEAIAKGVRA